RCCWAVSSSATVGLQFWSRRPLGSRLVRVPGREVVEQFGPVSAGAGCGGAEAFPAVGRHADVGGGGGRGCGGGGGRVAVAGGCGVGAGGYASFVVPGNLWGRRRVDASFQVPGNMAPPVRMKTMTATRTTTCRRCGRTLTSPRSLREAQTNGGYGRGCATKIE